MARAIALARLTGGRLHLAHLSTAGAVDQMRRAHRRPAVSAEVTPHHLLLTPTRCSPRGRTTPARGRSAAAGPPTDAPCWRRSRRHSGGLATDHSPRRGGQGLRVRLRGARHGLETALGALMELVAADKLSDLSVAPDQRPRRDLRA